MIDVILYEVVSHEVSYSEDLQRFKLYINEKIFSLTETELKRLRRVILERFPITEAETIDFDKKRALSLVEAGI